MSKAPILSAEEVSFSYKDTPVIRNVSFSLFPHEVVALVGASGVGKTTVLKMLAGILSGYSGCIQRVGQTAYMAQEDALLPWRTVYENIVLPFELGKKKRVDRKKLDKELAAFGLEALFDKYPHELSGGQKRRVCCVRMLLQNTEIMLFDEPFSAIDVHVRKTLFAPFREKAKEGKTILFVTHDFRDAYALADRILLLSEGALHEEWVVDEAVRVCQDTESRVIREIREALCSKYVGCVR